MVDRIKAAVDARTDPEFVIMARTDALAGEGLAAALDRCAAYVAAGADMIFAEAVTDLAMYPRFKESGGRAHPGQHHGVWANPALHRTGAGRCRRRHRALSVAPPIAP